MKKTIWNRLLSIVLAMALTLSGMSLDSLRVNAEEEIVTDTSGNDLPEEDATEGETPEEEDPEEENPEEDATDDENGDELEAQANYSTYTFRIALPEESFFYDQTIENATLALTVYLRNDSVYRSGTAYIEQYDNRGIDEPTYADISVYAPEGDYKVGYYFSGNVKSTVTNLQLRDTIYITEDGYSYSIDDAVYMTLSNNLVVTPVIAKVFGFIEIPENYGETYRYSDSTFYDVRVSVGYNNADGNLVSLEYPVYLNSSNSSMVYQCSLPFDVTEIQYIRAFVNNNSYISGNLATGQFEYLAFHKKAVDGEDGYEYTTNLTYSLEETTAFSLEECDPIASPELFRIKLLEAKVKVHISLPLDYHSESVASEFKGTLTSSYESTSGSTIKYDTTFHFSSDALDTYAYVNAFPLTQNELTCISVKVDSNTSLVHNLATKNVAYYTEDGLKFASSALKYTHTVEEGEIFDIGVSLRTTKLKVELQLSEDTYFTDVTKNDTYASVSWKDVAANSSTTGHSLKVYLDKSARRNTFYLNETNPDASAVTDLCFTISGGGGNLVTNQTEYYDGTTSPVSANPNYSIAIPAVIEGECVISMIPWTSRLSVKVKLPEGAIVPSGKAVSGTVFAKYSSKTVSTSFTIPAGETETTVLMDKLPADVKIVNALYFHLNNISGTTNLIYGKDEYYGGTKCFTVSSSATSINISETGTEIQIIPELTPAHIKLSLGEGAWFAGANLTGTFTVKGNLTANTTYSKSITIPEGESSVDFYLNDFNWTNTEYSSVYVKWNSANNLRTNLYLGGNLYYTDSGFTTNSSTCGVPLNMDDKGFAEFVMNKANTTVPVHISIPENSSIHGADLTGSVYVYYKSATDNSTRNAWFAIPAGETETRLEIPLDDSYSMPADIYGIFYKVNQNSACGTDIQTNQNYWFDGTSYYTSNTRHTFESVSAGNPIELVLKGGCAVTGKLVLPSDTYVRNEALQGTIYARVGSSTYYYDFSIPAGATEIPYTILLPEGTETISWMKVNLKTSSGATVTNLLCGKDEYYSETGAVYEQSLASAISLEDGRAVVNIEPVGIRTVTGSIFLPSDDAYLMDQDVTLTVKAYYNESTYSYYSTQVKLAAGELNDAYDYEIALNNTDIRSVDYIRVEFSPNSGLRTNLATDNSYVTEAGELVSDRYALVGYDFSSGDNENVDIYLETVPVLRGYVTLPASVNLGTGNASAYVSVPCYGENGTNLGRVSTASFKLTADAEGGYAYEVALKKGTAFVQNLSAYVTGVSGTNLYSGYVYRIDNTSSSIYSTNAEIEVNSSEVSANIRLIDCKEIKGTFTLPDSVSYEGGRVSADIYAYNENGTSSHASFYFENGDKTAEFSMLLPAMSESLNYFSIRFSEGTGVSTNIITRRNLYVGVNNVWASKQESVTATAVGDIPETIAIVYPEPKTITGSVSLESIATFSGGSLKLSIAAMTDVDSSLYHADEVVIDTANGTAEYCINLPLLATKVEYLQISGDMSTSSATWNLTLSKGDCYKGAAAGLRADKSLCEAIMLQNNTATCDIVLEAIRKVSGQISICEGGTASKKLNGTLTFDIGGETVTKPFEIGGSVRSTSYEVELPSGATSIGKMAVTISGENTNLVIGTMYYNATQQKLVSSELKATSIALEDAETVINLELQRRITLKGTVSLPSGGYFKNAPLNGYVKADVGETQTVAYFTFETGKTKVSYSMDLPVETETIDNIQIFVYQNSLLNSNILTGQTMYWTEIGWDLNSENAISYPREGRYEFTQNLSLPIARTVSGQISRREASEALDGSITVYNGGSEFITTFSLPEGVYAADYRISLPVNGDETYQLSYDISTQYVDNYCTDEVFLTLDGTYSLTGEFSEKETLKAGTNERNIRLAVWEDFKEDVILESPHPYASDGTYSMKYSYPGTAEGLEITFSKNTHFEKGFDDFYLIDEEGNQLLVATGDELAGQTVSIPVTSVEMVIDADVSNPSYGFGIESIKPVNGSLTSNLAVSVVYENDIPKAAVIHNDSDAETSFYMSAADYDLDGRMLSSTNKKIRVSGGMSVVSLDLVPNEQSSLGKLMLYSEKLEPLMEATFKVYATFTAEFRFNDETDTTRVVYVAENNRVTKPSIDPSREGYQFMGWFEEPACITAFAFDEYVTGNVVIYAGWRKLYEVAVEKSGNGDVTSTGLKSGFTAFGETVLLSAEPSDNAEFVKWEYVSGITASDAIENAENGTVMFVMPESNVRIRAVFRNAVDVTWLESNIYVENDTTGESEMTLPSDHKMIVPSEYSSISLKGRIDTAITGLEKVTYVYSYFEKDSSGEEIYKTDEEKTISFDASTGVFNLNDLKISAGSNSLTINFVYTDETVTSVDYTFTGIQDDITLKEGVTEMDLYDMTDMAFVEDLATGIEAYWNTEDGYTVLILDKSSEMAARLLSEEGAEGHIGIGSIWIIPCCDQFPTGFTFKIMDIGNSEYAPEPVAGDIYEGTFFTSDRYMYVLAGAPELSEMFDDSFSVEMNGFDGIAFTLLPENSVMNFEMEQEDGSTVMASSGAFTTAGQVSRKGFQIQNLARNIVPKATVNSNKVGLTLAFSDTVIYDKDGSDKTSWDQVTLGGSLNIRDMGVSGAWEWHPSANLNPFSDDFGIEVLPQQMGLLIDYTLTQTVKVQIGGTIGGNKDLKEGETNNAWSLSEVVGDFKKALGTGDNTKKEISFLGLTADIEGNNMDGSIVLAAVGFDLGTMSPVVGTYNQVATASTFSGFAPVLCFMVMMDIDGSVSGKFTYQYTKSSYHAQGFNVTKEGFSETNAKIKKQTPAYETNKVGYHIEVFNTTQASESDRSEAIGKHTLSLSVEATFDFDFCMDFAMLLSGLNVAQIKGGVYAEAGLGATGSVVLQKGTSPDWYLDGYVSMAVGLLVRFTSRLYAKTSVGNAGWDVTWDHKWPIESWGISSIGISGTVTTPSLRENVADPGLGGVEITLKTIGQSYPPITTTTDADGKYSFKNLTPNTSFTVELKKDGYVQKKEVTADSRVDVYSVSVRKKNFSMSKEMYLGITGKVVASDTGSAISGVNITLTNLSNSSVRYALTDTLGVYKVGKAGSATEGLVPGYYKLVVSADKYKTVSKKILVNSDTEKVITIDPIELVRGEGDEDCVIKGHIYDLATGKTTGVALKLYLRSGLDNTSGRILKTYTLGKDGSYSFTVPVGNYTIQVKDPRLIVSDNDRYITTNFNVLASSNTKTKNQDGYVSTNSNSDQVRIVLTWGETPRDLDSHLIGPNAKGTGKFHTYYPSNYRAYTYGGKKYADLDLDDTTSYGPETTTIYRKTLSGNYSYYVHDYSNRGASSSKAMSNSGAKVKVYIGSRLMATYNVPTNMAGTVWHVFDYNPVTNTLIQKDRFFNQSNPSLVGTASVDSDSWEDATEDEIEDLNLIWSSLEEKE